MWVFLQYVCKFHVIFLLIFLFLWQPLSFPFPTLIFVTFYVWSMQCTFLLSHVLGPWKLNIMLSMWTLYYIYIYLPYYVSYFLYYACMDLGCWVICKYWVVIGVLPLIFLKCNLDSVYEGYVNFVFYWCFVFYCIIFNLTLEILESNNVFGLWDSSPSMDVDQK